MIDNFTWPDPGEDWWTAIGASIGASGSQILFAAARASGSTVAHAGRLAGYENRQGAHAASRSVAVTRLLELHARQRAGTADVPIAGLEEIKQTLSALLRSPDPQISLSAAVKLAAIQESEQARAAQEETPSPDEVLLEILEVGGPVLAAATLFQVDDTPNLKSAPLLAPICKQECPSVWRRALEHNPGHTEWLEGLGNGPVLSGEELVAKLKQAIAEKAGAAQ